MSKKSKTPKATNSTFVPLESRPTLELVSHDYQPSRAELREDLRLKETFEEAAKALVKPVKIRKVMPNKGLK